MVKGPGPGVAPITASASWLTESARQYLNPVSNWAHNRNDYMGGSDIPQCERAVADKKKNPQDFDGSGFTARGHSCEAWLAGTGGVFERMQAGLQQQGHDVWFSATGKNQMTLIDEPLRCSVTPDGFLHVDGETIYLEIKSIDPRVNLNGKPRAKHVAQVQWGMEIAHRIGHSRPQRAFLLYMNASDFADITVFDIERDPIAARELLRRAQRIQSARSAFDLEPEGLLAGGAECVNCHLKDKCKAERIERIGALDETKDTLPSHVVAQLDELARNRVTAMLDEAEAKAAKERLGDEIRMVMEENNTSVAKTPGFAIRFSVTKGRETFDRKQAEADGLDLSPYLRTSNGSPRLTIRELD